MAFEVVRKRDRVKGGLRKGVELIFGVKVEPALVFLRVLLSNQGSGGEKERLGQFLFAQQLSRVAGFEQN